MVCIEYDGVSACFIVQYVRQDNKMLKVKPSSSSFCEFLDVEWF